MGQNVARYNPLFTLVHWGLALLALILLASGWYVRYMEPPAEARDYILEQHVSLGLTAAIFVLIQVLLALAFRGPPFPSEFAAWRKALAKTLYVFIYILFIITLISGYLQNVFNVAPVAFWGAPLPRWGVADSTLAGFFASTHRIAAFALVGAIVAHVGVVSINLFAHPGVASRMPLGGAERELRPVPVVSEPRPPAAFRSAQGLAKNLRLIGWTTFWLQLWLAVISVLLLAFATSGQAFSPSTSAFSDAIYWSGDALVILCVAVALAFYYTRAARRLSLRPEPYLLPKNKLAFWFLSLGAFVSILGILLSFVGLALSISLLIAKTVSQPPGIAITDPNKIIRALDVFTLLVNFILLMAHSVGTGGAVFLGIGAAKSRLVYGAQSLRALAPPTAAGETT